MAFLQITVWEASGEVANGDPIQYDIINTISGTAQQTSAIAGFNRDRKRVRVAVNGNCWVQYGSGVTATQNGEESFPMGTDCSTVEYFDIEAGHVVSVIERT